MANRDTFLLIADIAGYTRFMRLHRTSLIHAQEAIAKLLEAVIDAAPPTLKLAKLEGDAAFFYGECRDAEPALGYLGAATAEIYRAFHRCAAEIKLNTLCPCDGCQQVGKLKIKLVAHVGEVARQKVKHLTELAGIDVVLVHRLLKNTVPIEEYLLGTEPVQERLDALLRERGTALALDLEGIGLTPSFYVDLARYAGETPSPPRRSYFARLTGYWAMELRTFLYALGLRRLKNGFRNLPP